MMSVVIRFSALLMFIVVCAANDSEVNKLPEITEECLACLCQAESKCTTDLFHITEGYWVDAHKPTINGESIDSKEAYQHCTRDPSCASLAVRRYMERYSRDCNADEKINCFDYIAIHKMGPYACNETLPYDFVSVFIHCMVAFDAQRANHEY